MSDIKNKPATPLPWERDAYGAIVVTGRRLLVTGVALNTGNFNAEAQDNTDYIRHAANAYPRLVQALKVIYAQEDDTISVFRHREIGEILRELGEL